MTQATVRILRGLGELFHLTSATSAVGLAALSGLAAFLDFAGHRTLELAAGVVASILGNPLLRHASALLGRTLVTTFDGVAFHAAFCHLTISLSVRP